MIPTAKKPTKCRCGHKNSNGTCKNCSRVKMVALLASDDLKNTMPDGKKVNPVYYSYLKHNNIPLERIIKGMYKRFMENNPLRHATRKVHFYDNETKQLIAEN